METKSKNYILNANVPGSNPAPALYKPRNQPQRLKPPPVDDIPPPLPSRKRSNVGLPPSKSQNSSLEVPPPLPTRRNSTHDQPNIRHTTNTRKQEENPPPLPTRNRSSWTPSNDAFEERFKFHKLSDLPEPTPITLLKKQYPSAHTKSSPKQKPPPPPEKTRPISSDNTDENDYM
ncbi:hypothetical protein SNE40_021394 [Patella caerulea]|uniref:Uncharacterized protein n=1 Tax=Patella caerulea TaxID=87958 RepID=A0AAN8G4A5_PATCE